MNTLYGGHPINMGRLDLEGYIEGMYLLYLPIKMGDTYKIPKNLDFLRPIVEQLKEVAKEYEYMYVSCEYKYCPSGNVQKRPGWHVDSYLQNDRNFVYCDSLDTTEFVYMPVNQGPKSDAQGLELFHTLASRCLDKGKLDNKTLYELGKCIHRSPLVTRGHERLFIKISLSNYEYNLKGNSINYDFDYNWEYYSREEVRNSPSFENNGDHYK